MKRGLLMLAAVLLSLGQLSAREVADSMRIYYRQGYRYVEPLFRSNEAELTKFLETASEAQKAGRRT